MANPIDSEALQSAGVIPQGVELLDSPFPREGVPESIEEPKDEEQQPLFQSMDDHVIASMVIDRKGISRTFRQNKQDVWDKCWDHYTQNYDATGKEGWQSKRFWPETIKVVETICSNFSVALLGTEMPVDWKCKVDDFEERVKDLNNIVKNDVIKGKFSLTANLMLRELCLLGTSVGRVEYDNQKEIVMIKTRRKPNMMETFMGQLRGNGTPGDVEEFSEQEKVVTDYAKISYVDLYKIFPEPYTSEISKDHWVIEEKRITNAELIKGMNDPDEFYRLEGVTEELLRSGDVDESQNKETQIKRGDLNQVDVSMNYLDPDRPHTLDEYWGPAPLWMIDPSAKNDPDKKYDIAHSWFWVIDGKWVVRKKRNPHRDAEPPYFKWEYVKIPGDWWGIGPAEMMLWLQIEKNELVNTAIDNVNIILNKIIGVIKDKVAANDWERLKSEPAALWLFTETDDIRKVMMPIEFGNLLKDIYLMIDMVDRAIQEVTGAVKATIGVGGAEDEAGGGTFRGQAMNKQVATDRFMLYARTLEGSGMSSAFQKIYQRIYQYKKYESVEKVIGKERFKEFEFITPEDLDTVANLTPLGVLSMEAKAIKPMQMLNYDKSFANEEWYKRYDAARKLWVEMGMGDPDTVTFTSDEMKKFNEMKKMMTMGPPGGPGGPPPPPGGPMGPGGPPPGPGLPPGPPQGPLPPPPGGPVPPGPLPDVGGPPV